ncbi:MAG: hypothetical protein FJW39_31345 [Acidobacteria bacterium]|nr:hypothetical protein [Acidobacteriota bacterium]
MPETIYRGRRAVEIANEFVLLAVTVEGGHIARFEHRAVPLNPMWTPQWTTIEPSAYDPAVHTGFGSGPESKLLAGIFGHNLCLDLFGGPSPEEAAAGMTVHGESSVASYDILADSPSSLIQQAEFPHAQLRFRRTIHLEADTAMIREQVTNLSAWDRPSAWTQHVSLGAPFIEPGVTRFEIPATRSKVFEADFGGGACQQVPGAEFDWPHCPSRGGGTLDLSVYPAAASSAGYTAHLMDPSREDAWFSAANPRAGLVCGYRWRRADFPWLGRWEENRSRPMPPWNGREITCGMEFGVSPMPETRRQMIERGSLFGVPGYRWIPAGATVEVEYQAFVRPSA